MQSSPKSLQHEEIRIRFRQKLLQSTLGIEWLTHVAKLFDHKEQILGPGDFGLPTDLAVLLHKQEQGIETMTVSVTHVNTNVMSRLEEKMTEKLSAYGTPKPLTIPLWEDERPIHSLVQFLLNFIGVKKYKAGKVYTSLTIRYSEGTGFTLEGPSWFQIRDRLGVSIKDFFQRIAEKVQEEHTRLHGWELDLADTLAELDEL